MPPEEPLSYPLNSPLLHILSPKSSLNLTLPQKKSFLKMSLTKRKSILILVFILVIASLIRVLRITITTSYFPNVVSSSMDHDLITTRSNVSDKTLSEKELTFLSDIILQKSPCNLLVFGLEDQYLKLPTINKGGATVFLEDKPEKLMKMKGNGDGVQVFRIRYKTSAKEAYKLLKHARRDSSCSVRRLTSKCKIAVTGFPKEVLKIKWDVIVVDGPGGDGPESPGRMGAIYMAGVLARSGNGTNVVVHDVDRMIEKWFSWEFLSEKNLVSSKGKFWNFKIGQRKKLVSLKRS
ncbi:probable methyltransferase At1g27930 [Lactuca sativa]|uniref:probable methyltransferase At1g27930 n=1 Tax=Lactuca sativa TaxID=4236 RepID=UPI000CBDCBAB|nr:probable methyltransferase At1g27930 [Lactuca sativa]